MAEPTLTTRDAAAIAGVTVATVRHWARYGAIRATKRSGRWVIDKPSLLRRIALDKKAKKMVEITPENLVAIGGKRWIRYGRDRVYFDDWARFIGLEVGHYNTGRISWATLNGEGISNSEAYRILDAYRTVYYDLQDGRLYGTGGTPYRGREFADGKAILNAVMAGIKKAISAQN